MVQPRVTWRSTFHVTPYALPKSRCACVVLGAAPHIVIHAGGVWLHICSVLLVLSRSIGCSFLHEFLYQFHLQNNNAHKYTNNPNSKQASSTLVELSRIIISSSFQYCFCYDNRDTSAVMDPSTSEQHTISTEEANVAGAEQEQLEENDASRPSSSILTLDTQGFLDDTYNAVGYCCCLSMVKYGECSCITSTQPTGVRVRSRRA